MKVQFVILVALLLVLSACEQDDIVTPPIPPTTGFIILNPAPDSLPVSWTLAGPDGYSLSGASVDTVPDLVPGMYTCTWSSFEGWTMPDPADQTASLVAGDTLSFSGTYMEILPPWETWVTVPSGNFIMGASDDEDSAEPRERPQHQVTLTHPFLIQATEVTNAQYLEIALWALDQGLATTTEDGIWDNLDGSTDLLMDFTDHVEGVLWCEIGYFEGSIRPQDIGYGVNPNHPVKMITWAGAAAYCDWLSLRQGLARAYDHSDWSCGNGDLYNADGFRLPTEAEWEYSCRAGTTTAFYSGGITNPWGTPEGDTNEPALNGVAWYPNNSVDWTHPVAQLQPNDWGLYDMHGNLFKWVNGYEYSYSEDPLVDPTGTQVGRYRIIKGGAWTRPSHFHRAAYRYRVVLTDNADYGSPKLSFRPVRTVQ